MVDPTSGPAGGDRGRLTAGKSPSRRSWEGGLAGKAEQCPEVLWAFADALSVRRRASSGGRRLIRTSESRTARGEQRQPSVADFPPVSIGRQRIRVARRDPRPPRRARRPTGSSGSRNADRTPRRYPPGHRYGCQTRHPATRPETRRGRRHPMPTGMTRHGLGGSSKGRYERHEAKNRAYPNVDDGTCDGCEDRFVTHDETPGPEIFGAAVGRRKEVGSSVRISTAARRGHQNPSRTRKQRNESVKTPAFRRPDTPGVPRFAAGPRIPFFRRRETGREGDPTSGRAIRQGACRTSAGGCCRSRRDIRVVDLVGGKLGPER